MSDDHIKMSESKEAAFDPLQIGVSKTYLIKKIKQLENEKSNLNQRLSNQAKKIIDLATQVQTLTEDRKNVLTMKDTNPKDAIGISKAPLSTIPSGVLMELGIAMLEGALKYGRHNYRIAGVRASVYYDALARHMLDWWEGMDNDKDSGMSHLIKAIATLTVLRDAQMCDMMHDDRPPSKLPPDWLVTLNVRVKELLEKYPDPKQPYTQVVQKVIDDARPELETPKDQ